MTAKTESEQLKAALIWIKQLEAEHESLKAAVNAHYFLTRMILDGHGLEAITKEFGELIQTSVEIEDRFHNLLATCTYPGITDSYHTQRSAGHFTRQAEVERALEPFSAKLQIVRRSLELPAILELGLERNRLIAPVMVEGEMLGYVILLGKGRDFSPQVIYAIEHVVLVYAVLMMKEKSEVEVERRLRSDFLEDLVSEKSHLDEEMLKRRGPFFGFNPAAAYLYLVVDIDDFGSAIQQLKWDESLVRSFKREFYNELSRATKAVSRDSLLVSKSDSVIILARLGDSKEFSRQSSQFIKALQSSIGRLTASNGITISIVNGGVCTKLAEFPLAEKRARRCLELLKLLKKPGQIISYEDLGLYTTLFDHQNKEALFEFATGQIHSLAEYDAEHGMALVETLQAYFAHDKHLKKTAAACHIHLNALSYRLKRIQEIGNLRLDNPDTCFNLQLALKIRSLEKILKA